MRSRIIHSYPARLLFVASALAAALMVVTYRLLIKRDFQLLRANAHVARNFPIRLI